MAHIPPQGGSGSHNFPLTIKGEGESITIEFPEFDLVNTSMNITLGKGAGIAKALSVKETAQASSPFKSKITRIVLSDVIQTRGSLEFKPQKPGICTIQIFFEHPV